MYLNDARAYNSSLGLTAKGSIALSSGRASLSGTIVPVYFFNAMLGRLPLVGKLFSPEEGGGVFAARFGVEGPIGDPSISVNPVSALTPGFLRGIFGVFDSAGIKRAAARAAVAAVGAAIESCAARGPSTLNRHDIVRSATTQRRSESLLVDLFSAFFLDRDAPGDLLHGTRVGRFCMRVLPKQGGNTDPAMPAGIAAGRSLAGMRRYV